MYDRGDSRGATAVYDVSGVLPVASLAPGTNVLLSGPSRGASRELLLDVLADGARQDEGALLLTTDRTSSSVRSALSRRGADGETPVGVVDCTGDDGRRADEEQDPMTRHVDSPADFTGAGVAASELLAELGHEHPRTRVGVDSVSGLLAHADAKTVFRFLHVLTGRIGAADAVGIATIDDDAHDDQTVTTIRQLFDGLVEVHDAGEDRRLRVTGLADADGEWERV